MNSFIAENNHKFFSELKQSQIPLLKSSTNSFRIETAMNLCIEIKPI